MVDSYGVIATFTSRSDNKKTTVTSDAIKGGCWPDMKKRWHKEWND
jgi:hypothetical protein